MSGTRRTQLKCLVGLLVLGALAASSTAGTAGAPILDGPAVLHQSPAAIQAALGSPMRTRMVPPGDFLLPDGGIWRAYGGRDLRIDVDFQRERSTTVVIEFPDGAIAPRTYEAALEAINLPSSSGPDLVTRDSREWHNLHGYFVRVIASYPARDRIDTIILSVHPFP